MEMYGVADLEQYDKMLLESTRQLPVQEEDDEFTEERSAQVTF